MNPSTPGLPVHHQLPEFTQTHVHWVGDAIQPSHLLSSPSPPAFNLSQHQGLFKWVSSPHQVAKVLKFQLHYQSLQWTPRTDFLQDGLVGSPCSPRDSQESSPTPQFKSISSSADITRTDVLGGWSEKGLSQYFHLRTEEKSCDPKKRKNSRWRRCLSPFFLLILDSFCVLV